MGTKTVKLSEIVDIKYLLTEEEYHAVMEIRKKHEQDKLIQKCKQDISSVIFDIIAKIGLEETKRIVRELNRELRET